MIDVRRAGDRFTTETGWATTRHSFSFGAHYDPTNVGHGVLVAHNDDVIAAGAGYDTHPHADLEIVTWVLEGSLVHTDSSGTSTLVRPGLVQRLTAGSGVLHSERNDAPGASTPTRFVQMWLLPDESGSTPSYQLAEVGDRTGLTVLASGVHGLDAAVRVGSTGAALHLARLGAGDTALLPDAHRLHVFVARGAVALEGAGRLDEGDAARFTAAGGPRVTAVEPAEVLVWQLP